MKRKDPLPNLTPFHVVTSQEGDAVLRAVSDGAAGQFWETVEGAGRRYHRAPNASHRVQLDLSEDDIAAGATESDLEFLTLRQNADCALAVLFISRLLVPAQPLPDNLALRVWIDLDDVLKAIGYDPRSVEQRAEQRRRVWDYLRFGARARVVGQRSVKYKDKQTGNEIETYIEAPIWTILEEEKPVQPSLFPELGDVPVKVRLMASEEWTRLTTTPGLAQFLPLGEVLGAIPASKQSGAWARIIGLALANFWRRQPTSAMDGTLKPIRRELVERYPPATGAVSDLLSGPNPRYALQYWHGALEILCNCEFLAYEGDATRTEQQERERLGRQEWQERWLNEEVDLKPGPLLIEALKHIDRPLPVPEKRRRGRPRKNPL